MNNQNIYCFLHLSKMGFNDEDIKIIKRLYESEDSILGFMKKIVQTDDAQKKIKDVLLEELAGGGYHKNQYYTKYLKYKNKYLTLKEKIDK